MSFAEPLWLWGLLLLPAGYAGFLLAQKNKRARFERFARPELWNVVAPELDWNARLRKARVWLLAVGLILISLARPQWGAHEETVKVTGLDVMIVLDVSSSMEVEDVVPNRLKKAKHVIRTLLDRMSGDRVGVVAFAASSYVATPLTTDLDYVREVVDLLEPRVIANQGTDIGLGIDTAVRSLERGAEEVDHSRTIVLISDGEDHEGKDIEIARKVKDSGIRLFVLGVGTEAGGPVPVRDESGKLHGYKRDRKGQGVVSAFHPSALMKVAEAAGGRYWTISASEAEAEELLKEMGTLNRSEYAERKRVTYEERFQMPLTLAVLLLLIELSLPARRIALILFAALFLPAPAGAADLRSYLENEKGVEAFSEGRLEEAKKRFGTAQALDPRQPELLFNQGLVQMQEGDVDHALRGFEGAAQEAMRRGDSKLAAESFFNLGNAWSKKENLPEAVRSYLNTIDAARKAGDAALEKDARKNLELLARQQEQKQKQKQKPDQRKNQQQKEQEQTSDQNQDQQRDSRQSQQPDPQKDPQQDQGQDQREKQHSQTPRKQEFRSSKLSKEDAERVMSELSSREKELQAKLKRQRGRVQGQQKDW